MSNRSRGKHIWVFQKITFLRGKHVKMSIGDDCEHIHSLSVVSVLAIVPSPPEGSKEEILVTTSMDMSIKIWKYPRARD